jgi:hypothetical protein
MSWDTYEARVSASGDNRRESARHRAQRGFAHKITKSLTYKSAIVDGVEQNIAVLDDRHELTSKKVFSIPGEHLPHGRIVEWADSKWLITELDACSDFYEKGKMVRCNYLLKWINDVGEIVERWCYVFDGTKYLIGEKEKEVITIGDSRMAITIGKDSETEKLKRGARFLIDDEDAESVMAFQITKPNKMFNVFNGRGVYRFILNEVNVTDNDNTELRIADYYNWHPKKERIESDVKRTEPDLNPYADVPTTSQRGWI